MKETTKAYLAVTSQSLIIGLSFLFVKIGLRSADTMSLLAHRFTVAGMIFLQEKLFYYHYIGIIAILAGTIGFNMVSRIHSGPGV